MSDYGSPARGEDDLPPPLDDGGDRARPASESPARKQRSESPRRERSGSPRRERSASPRRERSASPVRSTRRDRSRSRERSRDRGRYRSPSRERRRSYSRDRGRGRDRSRSPRRRSRSGSRHRATYGLPQRREPPRVGLQMFVAGFNFLSTERDVERRFGKYGRVTEVRIVRDTMGKSRGFGFVAMDNEDDVRECIRAMNGRDWEGRRLQVELCRNPK